MLLKFDSLQTSYLMYKLSALFIGSETNSLLTLVNLTKAPP